MKKILIVFFLFAGINNLQAQDPFLGEVRIFAGNFAPRGWALCNGQLLPINQNQALFSLLGTTYGGNGQTTFALPDLRGRVPVHAGQGPGLSSITQGSLFGTETSTLTVNNMPAHSHQAFGVVEAGTSSVPTGNFPANTRVFDNEYGAGTTTPMNTGMIGNTGGGQPFDNRPPSLGINYIIALQGIFPSRN